MSSTMVSRSTIQVSNGLNVFSHWCAVAIAFVLPISVFALNCALALTLLSFLLTGYWRERFDIVTKHPVVYAAIMLYSAFLVASFFSPASAADINHVLHKYMKLVYLLFLIPLFQEHKWRERALIAFLLAMSVTVIITGTNILGLTQIGADHSAVFKNRIETSFLLAFAFYICAYSALFKKEWRWLTLPGALIFATDLLVINSGRTGYLVFSVLMFVLLWQRFKFRGVFLAAAALSLVFIALLHYPTPFNKRIQEGISAYHKFQASDDLSIYTQHAFKGHPNKFERDTRLQMQERLRNSFGVRGRSVLLRIQFVLNSIQLIRDHLWFGRGVGSFRALYYENYGPHEVIGDKEIILQDPHNEYLMIAVQLGLVGLALWLILLGTQWWQSFSMKKPWRHYGQAFIIAFAVACLCDAFLFLSCPGHFFVYFSAVLFGPCVFRTKTNETN